MKCKARLSKSVISALLCCSLAACGPFVVTETEYDEFGRVGSETVDYNDGGPPRVLSESGNVPESAISNYKGPGFDPPEPE